MKSTQNIVILNDEVRIKFPGMNGVLFLRKIENKWTAKWRNKSRAIKFTDGCVWVYLPSINVRISEHETGEKLVVDYENND